MKKTLALVILIFCFLMSAPYGKGQNFGMQMAKEWKRAFGIDDASGEYMWFGYPVDNFGLYTFYDPAEPKKLRDNERICATWRCLEVPMQTVDSMSLTERLRIFKGGTNYADVGQGGPVTIDATKQKKLALSLILPNLMQVLNVGGSLDWNKGVTTKLSIEKAYKRSVDRDLFRQFLQSQSTNQTLKDAFGAGKLVYVASDIVAENVTVELTVNKQKNASVDAALTKAAGTVLSSGSAAKFGWTSNGNGTFTLKINHPVIIAVQMRKQCNN